MVEASYLRLTKVSLAAAAAAAKSLQSCLTLCNPIDGSPPASSIPRILQARILEQVAISFSNACMHAKLLQSCLTLRDPMDCSLPGSSVQGIFQARVLEWVATAFTYSFSYLEPVYCSMPSSNCCFLTCIQVSQEAGQVVWYFHLFQNFPQFLVIYTVKGFGIVNKAEIDVFLELSCFFHNPADVGNLISGSSAFSKTSLNIRKFTVHGLLKPGLENFEH